MCRPLLQCLVSVLFSFFCAASALAQIADRIDVTIVEVPVTVADRSGNSVRGLTAGNFEVYADGKRVTVDHFEVIDLTKLSASSEATLPPAAYRNFLLLFDVANSAPPAITRAQRAATEFVQTQLSDRDLAAVATFTHEQGARMITNFNQDRALLLAAIATLGEANRFKVADPLMIATESMPVAGGGAFAEAKARAQEAFLEDRRTYSRESERGFSNEMRGRVRAQLGDLGGVARSLDRLRGQKQIILLSEGFDATLLTGRASLSSQDSRDATAAVASGELWKVDSDQHFGSSSENTEMSEMVELFRRSDVRLHAIDIGGLRTEFDGRDGTRNKNNDALFLLATPTGGTVLRNSNDLSGRFDELLRQQEVIYHLGFRAKNGTTPGEFHKLRVKLVGARGEVMHRAGYYDHSDSANTLETRFRLSEILMTSAAIRDVPLLMVAMPLPGADNKARVPVVIDASGPELLQGVTGPSAAAHLFIYAFDEKRKVVDFDQQKVLLDVTRTGDAVRGAGVRYVSSLNLPPGTYDVKALVRVGTTGRVGFTTTRIKVPEYGATAVLPPLVAAAPGSWVTLVSSTRGTAATSVLTLGEEAFIPRMQLEGAGDTEQRIALLLRGMPLETLAITPMLVAKDGSAQPAPIKLAGRTAPDEEGVVKLLFKLSPAAIAAGDYTLQFTVVSPGSRPTVVTLPVVMR